MGFQGFQSENLPEHGKFGKIMKLDPRLRQESYLTSSAVEYLFEGSHEKLSSIYMMDRYLEITPWVTWQLFYTVGDDVISLYVTLKTS